MDAAITVENLSKVYQIGAEPIDGVPHAARSITEGRDVLAAT